jgi:hypothetical protein
LRFIACHERPSGDRIVVTEIIGPAIKVERDASRTG